MEIVKSKKISLLVLLFSILFLFIGGCAFAQDLSIVRYDSYNHDVNKYVKTRVASYGVELSFNQKNNDNFYVGISSDSVNSTLESPLIYVYFPKVINPKGVDMTIAFSDGTKEVFKFIRLDDNCVSYQITKQSYRKLRNLKFNHIEFTGFGSYTNFLENDYFIKFFKLIS